VFKCPWHDKGMPLANTVLTWPSLTMPEQCGMSGSPNRANAGIPIFILENKRLL